MSDVSFEIGKSSYTAKLFGFIVLYAIFFGARIIARRYVGNPDMTFSVGDIIFWCFIVLIGILVVVSMIHEKNKPIISVSGKTVFYKGEASSAIRSAIAFSSAWN